MKRLLGLLLVMGIVGCGGGDVPKPKPSVKVLQTLKVHTEPGWVASVAFSPDGQRIVSGSSDNTLKIWDASEEAE